jgi:EAL domain-containing protein (putative c-di-GMP-specific phosphodiesterase class I)
VVVLVDTIREGVLIAAERIRKGVCKLAENRPLPIDLSVGIALYPEHGRTRDALLQKADRALYIAKKGGDKIHVGEEEYELDEHSVDIVFQPIVDTRTQEVLGYEALSRDPHGKMSILDLFKKYHVVGQLNELKCLCFKIQLKKAAELRLKRVFINVDFDVLRNSDVLEKPLETDVILEISEAEALHEIENFLEIATKWRVKGFKFAIDDFGAGFISLPFVARLVPDYIKMDRSTIVQAVSSEQFSTFLKDLMLAFRNYTREGIIAEGIETEKELKVMKDTGNYLVQGILFGKPKEMD